MDYTGLALSTPLYSMRHIYSIVWHILLPLVLIYLAWRCVGEAGYRRGWTQRLGLSRAPDYRTAPLWIHAASVGEVRALAPLINQLTNANPEEELLITTTTPTGGEQVRYLFADRVHHAYLPLDLPWAVSNFLKRHRPRAGLLMELELWPNLLCGAATRGIPMMLINARLSARSAHRYKILKPLLKPALATLSGIAAQSEEDANRFQELYNKPDGIVVMGNLKFDQPLSDRVRDDGRRLREKLGVHRPVWIAASTRDGEETLILDAHKQVIQNHPEALLILVPRHPQRFNRVADLISQTNMSAARFSQCDAPSSSIQVWLGDVMGQLIPLYACTDIAFVGGSLLPFGGHNPLEPAALGIPVIMGPSDHNFSEASALLRNNGGAIRVSDSDTLAKTVSFLIENPKAASEMSVCALQTMTEHRGSSLTLLKILAQRGLVPSLNGANA